MFRFPNNNAEQQFLYKLITLFSQSRVQHINHKATASQNLLLPSRFEKVSLFVLLLVVVAHLHWHLVEFP